MALVKEIEINKKGSVWNILAAFVCDAILFILIYFFYLLYIGLIELNIVLSPIILSALVLLYFVYYVAFYFFVGSTVGMKLFYLKFNKDKNIPGLFVYKSNIKIDEKEFNARKFNFFKSILAVILDILLAPLIIALIAVFAIAFAAITAPVSIYLILLAAALLFPLI